MREVRRQPPRVRRITRLDPVEELTMPLAQHYGQRAERYRAGAQGYIDDKLREAFPPVRGARRISAVRLLRRHHEALLESAGRWSGLQRGEMEIILNKIEERAAALRLSVPVRRWSGRIVEVTSLVTALGMEFAYTGRLSK